MKSGLHLMQKQYITELLEKTKMEDAKPVSTPMSPTPKLSLNSGERLSNPNEYRRVVGSLQYLSLTRPDVAFAVNRYLNSCTNRLSFTDKQSSVCSDIWLVLRPMAFSYDADHHSLSMLTLMLIGKETLMSTSPPTLTLSTLTITLYHGCLRSKQASQGPRQKQNTELSPILPLNSGGSAHSSLISVYHCRQFLLSIATMLEQLIFQQIPSSTPA